MKWMPGIALMVILLATLTAFAALRSMARGSAPSGMVQLAVTGSGNAAAALAAEAAHGLATYATVQVDTPPRPRPARGWPFQQLPLVAKMEFPAPPVPTIEVSYVPPPFVVTRIPMPPLAPPPVLPTPTEGPSPLWLLLPLAAGAGFGDSDEDTDADTQPPTLVIPEPGTLLLMGTGLAGIAGGAYRRKRRDATAVKRE